MCRPRATSPAGARRVTCGAAPTAARPGCRSSARPADHRESCRSPSATRAAPREPRVVELARDVEVLAHRAANHGDTPVERHRRRRSPAGAGGCWRQTMSTRFGPRNARISPPSPARRSPPTEPCRCGRRSSSRRRAAAPRPGPALPGGRCPPAGRRRGLVELVVAGDQHGAEVAGEGDRAGVRDRVRHVHQLDVERPGLDHLTRFRPRSSPRPSSLCSSILERASAIVSGAP